MTYTIIRFVLTILPSLNEIPFKLSFFRFILCQFAKKRSFRFSNIGIFFLQSTIRAHIRPPEKGVDPSGKLLQFAAQFGMRNCGVDLRCPNVFVSQ